MPAYITIKNFSDCVGVNLTTAQSRLSELPFEPGRARRFTLASALPKVRASERMEAVPRLIKAAEIVPNLYVGDSIASTALALEAWLSPDQARRLFECRVAFTASLASLASGDLMLFHERLRLALALNHDVLFFVLGATSANTLPEWPRFGPAFAISNAREEDLLSTKYKESVNG